LEDYSSEKEAKDYRNIENKLIILYILDKMDLPLSYNQISKFVLEENYMNYFALQQSLAEMTEVGFLDKTQDSNHTRYIITEEGLKVLKYFEKNIPLSVRNKIIKYVGETRKSVKRDFEITSNYFYDYVSNDYLVKCGAYEDETILMEINISVVSRDQAKLICNNWKANINTLYGKILNELIREPEE